jgi:hypothetical protein
LVLLLFCDHCLFPPVSVDDQPLWISFASTQSAQHSIARSSSSPAGTPFHNMMASSKQRTRAYSRTKAAHRSASKSGR